MNDGNVVPQPAATHDNPIHEIPNPIDVMLPHDEESLVNKAAQANAKRSSIERVIQSSGVKIVTTGFLLISLFAASFLVAYQEVEKTKASEAVNQIPEAEIILPKDTSRERQTGAEGEMCAGIAGIECDEGLTCNLESTFPDASGICIK